MTQDLDAENRAQDPHATTVFFSYSRADQAKAMPIIQAIRDAGYRVWWDGMLEVGETFLETTEQALETAKAVVVLWSATSTSSHWVRDEATSGRIRNRLVPLSLDGTQPPLGFRQVQVIDMKNWSGRSNGPAMLQIKRVLAHYHDSSEAIIPSGSTASVTSDLPTTEIIARSARSPSRRRVLWGGVGAATVVIGSGLAAKGLLGGRASFDPNSLAVLPFENLSNDPEYDYISNGLSSEIRNSLASNSALMVVARSSSHAAVQGALNAKEIGKKLGVAHLLEGSVNVFGDAVRISVNFIDSKTGYNQWAKSFEHNKDAILNLHSQITDAVNEALSANLQLGPLKSSAPTGNAAAFNAFLKAENIIKTQLDADGIQKAISFYEMATDSDPNFGSAHAGKAQALLWQASTTANLSEAQRLKDEAVSAAEKAVEVSPDLSSGYSVLGYILTNARLDIKGAKAPYEKAGSLGSGNSAVLARYATYMALTGKNNEALFAAERAKKLDPYNPTMFETLGFVHFAAGRFAAAIQAYEQVLALNPGRFNAFSRIGLSQMFIGNIEAGLRTCEDEKNAMERLPCQAIGFGKMGDQESAQSALDDLIKSFGDAGAYQQAQVYAAWGEADKAIATLNKAYDLSDTGLTLLFIDPAMTTLIGREDYSELLVKMGFNGY